jgi:hypothetical protein
MLVQRWGVDLCGIRSLPQDITSEGFSQSAVAEFIVGQRANLLSELSYTNPIFRVFGNKNSRNKMRGISGVFIVNFPVNIHHTPVFYSTSLLSIA